MIISTAIQKNPSKVCTDSFVAVNLHPHHQFYFSVWIKNIAPAVNTGERAYFWNHNGSYYDAMTPFLGNTTVFFQTDGMES